LSLWYLAGKVIEPQLLAVGIAERYLDHDIVEAVHDIVERRTCSRVLLPAVGHQLGDARWAIGRHLGTEVVVAHGMDEGRQVVGHLLERLRGGVDLPEHDAERVDVALFVVVSDKHLYTDRPTNATTKRPATSKPRADRRQGRRSSGGVPGAM